MTAGSDTWMTGARIREPVDPHLRSVLEAQERREAGADAPTTPIAIREQLRRSRSALSAYRPEVYAVEDLQIPGGDGHHIPCRLYRASRVASFVIVYFHGGGWVVGDLDTADGNARHTAVASGADVLSVDYRKAPEHPFPAGLNDAMATVDYAARHLVSGRPLAVAGDSAGANLAAVCARRLSTKNGGPVAAQLLAYPVTDCDLTRSSYLDEPEGPTWRDAMTWCWDHYTPIADDRMSPDASPLRAQDLGHAAPAVIVLAGHDGLYDEGLAYASGLSREGVSVTVLIYESAVHGFLAYAGLVDLSTEAMSTSGRALREIVVVGASAELGHI